MQDFLKNFWQKGRKVFLIFIAIVAVIIIVLIIGGIGIWKVSSPQNVAIYGSGNEVASSMVQSDMAYSGKTTLYSPAPSYGTPATTPTLPSDKKVIKSGSVSILVKNAEDTASKIGVIAESVKGFVENINIYEVSEGLKSGYLSVRIPSDKFNFMMTEIKKLAVKVSQESISAQDVTAQYVDLEAQVKNYRAEERQYQEIMARATKIQDVLDVAQKLAEVRGRIERTQGQLNYLSRQVDMSTISVSMTAEPEVKVFGIVWRPLTVLKQSFKSLLSDLTGFVDWLIKFVFKIPVYILRISIAVMIVLAVWRIILWSKRKIWK